jgi:ABC-2 type transport system ATP-binding protein
VVVKHGTIAFHGPTSKLAAQAAGLTWHLTRPAGAPAPDLPTVTVSPAPEGVRYRVISAASPAPDAEPAEATAEDGYLALMRDTQPSARRQSPGTADQNVTITAP